MIIRRAHERGQTKIPWLESYHTFSFGDYYDPDFMGFHALRVINDDIVAPASGFDTHSHRDMEIITIMLSGALLHRDSLDHEQTLNVGEVQVMTAGRGILHSEHNASKSEAAHLIQTWILPRAKGLTPRYDQKDFKNDFSEKSLVKVASGLPHGTEEGALLINQDAEIYVGNVSEGSSLSLPVPPKLSCWIHVTSGSIVSQGTNLFKGDGIGFERLDTVSLEGKGKDSSFLAFMIP